MCNGGRQSFLYLGHAARALKCTPQAPGPTAGLFLRTFSPLTCDITFSHIASLETRCDDDCDTESVWIYRDIRTNHCEPSTANDRERSTPR
jgi:hypothetical protein